MQATAALLGIREENKEVLSWCKEKKVIYYYEGKYIPLATANPIVFKEIKDGK